VYQTVVKRPPAAPRATRAAAKPSPVRDPTRGDAAALDAHRASAREGDDRPAAHGDVATGRHEPRPVDEPERVVDRERLDDAVQVEPDA
jgi:hypothetical protein